MAFPQTLWDILDPRKRKAKEPRAKAQPKTGAKARPASRTEARAEPAVAVRLKRPPAPAARGRAPARPRPAPATPRPVAPPRTPPATMADRYEELTRVMLARYGVRVRKWRGSMSGVAWQITYHDGTVSRLIEAPKPRGPMSAAIFLHEIGHHAIGFHTYKPRCLEEYHAWRFAIETMHAEGLNVTARVHDRMRESLEYAVDKARRRGLKQLPAELLPYARRTRRR